MQRSSVATAPSLPSTSRRRSFAEYRLRNIGAFRVRLTTSSASTFSVSWSSPVETARRPQRCLASASQLFTGDFVKRDEGNRRGPSNSACYLPAAIWHESCFGRVPGADGAFSLVFRSR